MMELDMHCISQMHRHLISDAHQWINDIPTVPIYYLAKSQPRERAWKNQRGKKTLFSWVSWHLQAPRWVSLALASTEVTLRGACKHQDESPWHLLAPKWLYVAPASTKMSLHGACKHQSDSVWLLKFAGWLGIRIMCLSGSCLSPECCFNELIL